MNKLFIFIASFLLLFITLNQSSLFQEANAIPNCEISQDNCLAEIPNDGSTTITYVDPRPDPWVPTSIYDPNIEPTYSFIDGYHDNFLEKKLDDIFMIGDQYYIPYLNFHQKSDSCAYLGTGWVRTGYDLKSYLPSNFIGTTNATISDEYTYTNYSKDLHYERYDLEWFRVYEIRDECKGYEVVRKEWEITDDYIYYRESIDLFTQSNEYFIPVNALGNHLSVIQQNLTAAEKTWVEDLISAISLAGAFQIDKVMATSVSFVTIPVALLLADDYIMEEITAGNINDLDDIILKAMESDNILYINQTRDIGGAVPSNWMSEYSTTNLSSVTLYIGEDSFGNELFASDIEISLASISNIEAMLATSDSESFIDSLVDWFLNR